MNPTDAARIPDPESRPARSILIVEDDRDFRESMEHILDHEGFAVQGVANGREALDHLRWGMRPCVILLDLRMRLMTGWDFRAEQKKDPEIASIPVVAMTAGPWTTRDMSALDDRIEKPIDIKKLRAILDRYC